MACVYWIHLPEHTDISREGYIGFTSKRPKKRWSQHWAESKRSGHYPLYKAFAKYDEEICFKVLVIGTNEYCLSLEKTLRPRRKIGWNLGVGGDSPLIGHKHSDAFKQFIGGVNRGKIVSPETRRKLSVASTGRKHTEATKRKMKAVRAGWRPTSDQIKRRSITRTGSKDSPETIENKRAAQRGKKLTEACKAKLRAINLGKKATEETKSKIRLAHLGKPKPCHSVNVQCPHCGATGKSGGMKRWHFDHCKQAPDSAA